MRFNISGAPLSFKLHNLPCKFTPQPPQKTSPAKSVARHNTEKFKKLALNLEIYIILGRKFIGKQNLSFGQSYEIYNTR